MRKSYRFVLAIISLGIVLSVLLLQSSSGATDANQTRRIKSNHTGQTVVDSGDLRLRYKPRKKLTAATQDHVVGSNAQTIEKLLADLNQRIKLPFDIYVVFVDCDSPDAFYEPETHEITLCYQLIDEFYSLFARKLKDQKELDSAVKAAMVSTFFHELGHGLVDAWKIPITGREEDAVDQLSTVVLIEATEGGERMALEGALTFKLYADTETGEKIYWDEHSLDEQRFFDTICLVYGHDVEKYAYLVKNGTLPEERAAVCSEDYARVNRSWRQLLAPYLKMTSQPRRKLR